MRNAIPVVVALGLLGTTSAFAKRVVVPKPARVPKILAAEAPIGGAHGKVVIPFQLYDPRRIPCDVDVQYGYDRNGDGRITDGTEPVPAGSPPYPNEFTTATEDRLDSRDSRRNKSPRLFSSAADIGAAQGFVWKSDVDLPFARLISLDYALTSQGRRIADPDNPGSFVLATGPDGNAIVSGVEVRLRGKPHHGRPGAWTVTKPFDLDNTGKPSMTIDAAAPDVDDPATILVDWTAFHPDSEDFNGNGRLDVAAGEDINNDGKLFTAPVGVAFDWHVFAPGADPSTMTPAQLAKLAWSPCTRKFGAGDTDSLDARPGVPVPATGDLAGVATALPGVGRHWVFAWDTAADVRNNTAFILRATPFDSNRNQGATIYSKIVVRPGQ